MGIEQHKLDIHVPDSEVFGLARRGKQDPDRLHKMRMLILILAGENVEIPEVFKNFSESILVQSQSLNAVLKEILLRNQVA
jgi:hypothetical protein